MGEMGLANTTSNTGNTPEDRSQRLIASGAVDEIAASNGFDRYVCSSDAIILSRGTRLLVRGWASEPANDGPSANFVALLDGREIVAHYR